MNDLKSALAIALSDATTKVMNNRAPDLPPLSWRYDAPGAEISGYASEWQLPSQWLPDDAAAAWAARFNLADVRKEEVSGVTTFAGEVLGLTVEVWYVSDQDKFDAMTARYTANLKEANA